MSYNRPGRAQPRRQHPSRRRRGGFTLVEILTAIAIIAILVSMAFLGFKYASSAPKKNLTETTLHNVGGMLAEFEAQNGRMKDLLAPYMDTSTPPKPLPVPVTFEVLEEENLHTTPIAPPVAGPKPAYGSKYYDIYVTAYEVMPRLRAIPANRSVFDAIPIEHVYPRRWSAALTYPKDARVQSGNGCYVCVQAVTTPNPSAQPPELDTARWRQDAPNYLVLDAWGSPLIYVPPAGAVEMFQGGTVSDPSQPLPAGVVKRVIGGATPATTPRQSPDRKGYFMSAGPDRNFGNGDDNLFSFDSK